MEIIEYQPNKQRIRDTFLYMKQVRDRVRPGMTDDELMKLVERVAKNWEIKKANGLV